MSKSGEIHVFFYYLLTIPLVTRTPTVISSAIRFIELKIIMHIMYIVKCNQRSLLAVLQW